MLYVLLLVLTGVLTGTFGALFGLGGGFILVPALTLLFGVPMHTAVAASQLSVIATSVRGSFHYLRLGLVNLELAFGLLLSTTAGAAVGAGIGGRLDATALGIVFSLVLVFMGLRMTRSDSVVRETEGASCPGAPTHWRLGQAGAFVGGMLGGLLGIGGGIINVPLFCMGMNVPMKVATATSSFLVGVTGASSASVYYSQGFTDLTVSGAAVVGSYIGGTLGARIGAKMDADRMRVTFAGVCVLMGVIMFLRSVGVME